MADETLRPSKGIHPSRLKSKDNTIVKSSKVISTDYYKMNSLPEGTVDNSTEQIDVEQVLIEDEEIRGFYGYIADTIASAGYKIVGNEQEKSKTEKFLEDIKFDEFYDQLLDELPAKKDVFVEIIKNKLNSKITELKIQPSSKVKPKIDEKGKLLGYCYSDDWVKKPIENGKITWQPEEMVHIQIDKIGSGIWTTTEIKTLKFWINLKRKVEWYLDWSYTSNLYKPHLHAKHLGVNDTKAFVESVKEGMKQKDKFLITAGEEDLAPNQLIDPSTIQYHLNMLDECRNKILTLIRVPPIVAGTVDNSNRSNSDVQARFTFAKRIKRLMRAIERNIKQLFKAIGIESRIKFQHNAIDLRDEIENVDIALKLLGAGADKKMIVQWLNNKGLELPEGLFDQAIKEHNDLLEQQKEQEVATQSDGGVRLPKNSNLNPSRQPVKKDSADVQTGSRASTPK